MNDVSLRVIEDLRVVKEQIVLLTTQLAQQDRDSVQRDTEISATQDKLQIKVLIFILTTIVGIIVALLVFYITHAH
jgi:predicted secreted protein